MARFRVKVSHTHIHILPTAAFCAAALMDGRQTANKSYKLAPTRPDRGRQHNNYSSDVRQHCLRIKLAEVAHWSLQSKEVCALSTMKRRVTSGNNCT